MNLRDKFISLLKAEGVSCNEQIVKPYQGTIWSINNHRCYIPRDKLTAWFQVPTSALDLVDVLIFLTSGNSIDMPKPILISTQDFRPLVNGEPPMDGAYNVNITRSDWPYIDLRVSLGDRKGSTRYSLDDGGVVFDTFELLENENDDPKINEAFRRVEAMLK